MRREGNSGWCGGRTPTVDPCVGRGETDHPLGDTEMGSVQGAGIQTRGRLAYLEEVSQQCFDCLKVTSLVNIDMGMF